MSDDKPGPGLAALPYDRAPLLASSAVSRISVACVHPLLPLTFGSSRAPVILKRS
jgi:hypothetical protein